jgi:hypothetical protein
MYREIIPEVTWTMTSLRFSRFCIFSLAAALVFAAALGVEADRGSVGVVKVFGAVQVRRADAAAWITASERMRLRSGDRLKTGDGGWCYVELSEGNIVKMTEKSAMVLEGVENTTQRAEGRILFAYRGTGAYNVKLEYGHIMPVLERFSGSSMRLTTPVAVAGVRGTIFEATVEPVGVSPAELDAAATRPAALGAFPLEGAAGADGATYNVDFTVHQGGIEVTDLASASAGATFVPAGYSMSFQNVRVPRGGFSAAAGGPGGLGGGRAGGRDGQAGGQNRGGVQGPGRGEGAGVGGQGQGGAQGAGPRRLGDAVGGRDGQGGGGMQGGARIQGNGGASATPGASGAARGAAAPVAGGQVGTTPSGPRANLVKPTNMGANNMVRGGAQRGPGGNRPLMRPGLLRPGMVSPLIRPPILDHCRENPESPDCPQR